MAPTVRLVGDLLVFTFRYDPALNTALREAAGVRWDPGRKAFTLRIGRLRQAGAAERLGRFVVESGFEADDEVRTLLGLAAPAGSSAATESGLPAGPAAARPGVGGPGGVGGAVLGPGRLQADLLPSSTWGSNLRGVFTAEEWDALRIPVCTAAGNRCEVCGAESVSGGRRRRPDCHELWAFDHARGVQRLVRLIALCPDCHRVQHAGLAQLKGETPLVVDKLRAVNGWTVPQVDRELDRAWAEYQRRERRQWDLDLSVLRGTVTVEGYPELYIRAAERDLLGNSFHPA